jgi:hypothetical protein
MKITKTQLKQIIKEEISRTLDENEAVPSQATTEAAQEIRNLMTGGDPIGNVRAFLVKNKTEDNIIAAIEAFRPYAAGDGDEYDKFVEELTVALNALQ